MTERQHIETAAAALGDEHAAQIRICKQVIETEKNIHVWRVAVNRYAELIRKAAA